MTHKGNKTKQNKTKQLPTEPGRKGEKGKKFHLWKLKREHLPRGPHNSKMQMSDPKNRAKGAGALHGRGLNPPGVTPPALGWGEPEHRWEGPKTKSSEMQI